MPKSANPRRNPRFNGEHVGRPTVMALVPVQFRDPECLLHQPNVFDVLFPENRTLEDLDWCELDALCTCKHEAHEPTGARRRQERKPKVCPVCRTAKSLTGDCFC